MLTEEAHHMFVGDTGINRIVKRTAQLMKEGDVRQLGGIPLDIIQKHVNFWFSYSLDLFGGEISSNSADFFAAGLKGRYKEQELYSDHLAADQTFTMTVVADGKLGSREVALRNALNEVLRGEYVTVRRAGALEQNPGRLKSVIMITQHTPSPWRICWSPFDIEGNPITAEGLSSGKRASDVGISYHVRSPRVAAVL